MTIAMPDDKKKCHHSGFTKKCRVLVMGGACDRWKTFEGENPANGQPMVESMCLDDWQIVMQLDIARKVANGTHRIQQAVEGARNTVVRMARGQDPDTPELLPPPAAPLALEEKRHDRNRKPPGQHGGRRRRRALG
jgi:hypothetical protein